MGKGQHLNPILSSPKKTSTSLPSQKPRKINSNKLHDIKIPVNEVLESLIRREAVKNWGGSKTFVSTELFLFGMEYLHVYPEVKYQDGPITVHVKINHEIYMKLGEYAARWKCSMRQAAHRIFMEAVKKKQVGGVIDGEV